MSKMKNKKDEKEIFNYVHAKLLLLKLDSTPQFKESKLKCQIFWDNPCFCSTL